jgi:hypothetical protein
MCTPIGGPSGILRNMFNIWLRVIAFVCLSAAGSAVMALPYLTIQ